MVDVVDSLYLECFYGIRERIGFLGTILLFLDSMRIDNIC